MSATKGVVPQCMRLSLLQAVAPLLQLSHRHVTVDRGHSFSAGHSVANFWLSPLSDQTVSTSSNSPPQKRHKTHRVSFAATDHVCDAPSVILGDQENEDVTGPIT